MKLAASNVNDLFGNTIKPPVANGISEGPVTENIATLFAFSVTLVFIIGGIILLLYLLWGALEWITSGGDKENLEKARRKITNGFVGIFILISVFVLWLFAMSTFGLMTVSESGISFELPTIDNQ